MGIRIRAVALGIAALLAACGNTGTRDSTQAFLSPNQTALVIALDPRVGIPQGSDPSFDVGRLFGESMIAAMARDPRILAPAAPPANVLHIWVRSYAAAGQTQVSMTAGAQLDDSAGKKLWTETLSITRTSIQAASDELASRLRGDMMLAHGWLVNQPGVATGMIGSRPRQAAAAVQAMPAQTQASPAPAMPAPVALAAPARAQPEPPPVATTAQAEPPAALPLPPPPPPKAEPKVASPAPAPRPAAAKPAPAKPVAGEISGTVARNGAGLRKQPQAWQPLTKALATGATLKLSSRLENEYGIWWYAKSDDGSGWIPEADVTLP